MAAYRAAWALLDTDPPAAAGAFAVLRRRQPDDPLIALHAARLEAGETGSVVRLHGK